MREKETILAKGIYKHPQAGHYISAKQYMFVHKDGKKHLILRYTNDMSVNVDSMKLVLTEMDTDGKVISTRRIEHKGLRAEAGATFAPNEGIPISDECMDFKIKVVEAGSGVYTYRVRGRRVCTYYTPPKPRRVSPPMGTPEFSVAKMKKPSSRAAAFLSMLIVVLFIGASILVSYFTYIQDYKRRHRDTAITEYYYDCREL